MDFDFTKYNKEKYQNQITAETRFKLNTSYKEDTQYTPISHDPKTQVTGFGVRPLKQHVHHHQTPDAYLHLYS